MPRAHFAQKIVDSTKAEYQPLLGAVERERDLALWFDTHGCGPEVVDWTVRVMPEADPADAHIGIEFHGLGGPFMTIKTAERMLVALGKALEIARRGGV